MHEVHRRRRPEEAGLSRPLFPRPPAPDVDRQVVQLVVQVVPVLGDADRTQLGRSAKLEVNGHRPALPDRHAGAATSLAITESVAGIGVLVRQRSSGGVVGPAGELRAEVGRKWLRGGSAGYQREYEQGKCEDQRLHGHSSSDCRNPRCAGPDDCTPSGSSRLYRGAGGDRSMESSLSAHQLLLSLRWTHARTRATSAGVSPADQVRP